MKEDPYELSLFAPYETPHNFAEVFALRTDLMACVRQGDVELLKDLLARQEFCERGQLLLDGGRGKTVFLFVQAMALYEAVSSGVLLEKGCALALSYQRILQGQETPNQVLALIVRQLQDYTALVREDRLLAGKDQRIRRCLEYLYEHLCEEISLKELAASCWVSPTHLERLFRAQMGTTIRTWVRREKVRRAQFLLQHTDMACAEIGQRLNYASQSYFAKLFRQETGLTPLQWRRQHS